MFAAQVKTRKPRAVSDSGAANRPKFPDRAGWHPAIGNQAALRMLSAMQTNLRVSQPEDPSEREAETAADWVMAIARPDAQIADHGVDRVHADAAMPGDVRGFMESRFDTDFGGVRFHNDATAHRLADTFAARAFTVGPDIYFAQDQFAPGSDTGRRLIAHELAHVIQQGTAGGADVMRQVEEPETPQAQAPEMSAPMPEEETKPEDEEGAETELPLEEIGFTLPALSGFAADTAPGRLRIDRQPKPKPKPKAPAPKPSGVTVGTVQVLPDQVGATEGGTDGETDFKIKPKISYNTKNGKISSFSGAVARTIQTTYQPGVDKKSNSAYGRGTTTDDKNAGNTSLQFHESQHVQDYKNYFDKNPLPQFTGKEGMTEDDFKKAVADYLDQLKKYSDSARDSSKQSTDCVGTKEKTCQ